MSDDFRIDPRSRLFRRPDNDFAIASPADQRSVLGIIRDTVHLDVGAGQVVDAAMASMAFDVPLSKAQRRVDPDFNPFSDPDTLKGYERWYQEFEWASSPEEVEMIKARIDQSLSLRTNLEDHAISRFLGNFLDPINVVPVGMALGQGFKKGATIAAATTAVPLTASELIRHNIDPTATKMETMFGIAGGVAFTSLLGGLGGKFIDPEGIRASVMVPRALDYLVPIRQVHGETRSSVGVPMGFGVLSNIYKRLRRGYETTANKIDDHLSPSNQQIKRKDGRNLRADLPEGTVRLKDGTKMEPVESDFYPTGYMDQSPLESLRLHQKMTRDAWERAKGLEDVEHLERMAEGIGKSVDEVKAILKQDLDELTAELEKAAGFFKREDVQKQLELQKELGLDEAAKVKVTDLDNFEIVTRGDLDIVNGITNHLRNDRNEFKVLAKTLADDVKKSAAKLKELEGKIDTAKTKAWSTRHKKKYEELAEAHKHLQMNERIARSKLQDIEAVIANKNARQLVEDWGLAPAALNKIMSATKQFPWWFLLKNDFRAIDPELGKQIQEFALAMASSPGLNTKGNLAFRSLGPSVEALKHEWMGPYYAAKRHKERMYTKYIGLGEDTTAFSVYWIDFRQRFRARREQFETGSGRKPEARTDERMTLHEWNEAVSDALLRGTHEIPEVVEAAKPYRDIWSRMSKEALELGIFETQRVLKRDLNKAKGDASRKKQHFDRLKKKANQLQKQRGYIDERMEAQLMDAEADYLRELEHVDWLEGRLEAYEQAASPEFADAGYYHIMYDVEQLAGKRDEVVDFLEKWFRKKEKVRIDDQVIEPTRMGEIELRARAREAYASMMREAELGDAEKALRSTDKRPWLEKRKEILNQKTEGTALHNMPSRHTLSDQIDEIEYILKTSDLPEPGLRAEATALKNRLARIEEDIETLRTENPDAVMNYLRKEMVIDKLEAIKHGKPYGGAGPLLARHLDVPPQEWANLGILITDIDQVMAHYVSRMAPQIEIAKKFGTHTAQGHINRIVKQMKEVIQKKIDKGELDDAGIKRWEKKIADYEESMTDLRDIVSGFYQIPDNPAAITPRVLRLLRNFNMLAAMGRSVMMAFGDVGNIIISQGFTRTFGHFARRFASGLKDGNIRLIDKEVELAGAVMEVAMGMRYHSYAELGHQWMAGTKFEKGVANATARFFMNNLMGPWTDMSKRVAGGLVQSKLIENSIAWRDGTIKPSEAKIMSRLNITKQRAVQIADEWEASGSLKHETMFIANTEHWVSDSARRAFRAAMNDEINRMVIVPGAVDKPKMLLKSEWAKVFLQYKGFGISASNRIFAAGLQQEGASKISGMLSMVAIAMAVDAFKRPDYIQMSLDEQLLRAVELSGVTGILLDLNDTLERASAGAIGLRPTLGMDIRERNPNWANRVGALAGAVPNQWLTLMYGLTSDEASTNDTARGIRYMIPYNNFWMFNEQVNRVQRAAVDLFED